MTKKRRTMRARFLLMDARAFDCIDNATVFDTADSVKEAIQRSKAFGNYRQFNVAIVDAKKEDVCWELYAGKK